MAGGNVVLGGFVFLDHEIPASIPIGGKQSHKIHDVIGNNRTVDAMGPMPSDKKWSGRFRGPAALARCNAVDAMRIAGAEVELSWFGQFYLVLITEFEAPTEKAFEIPYTITCVVVDDPAQEGGGFSASLDSLVGGDLATAVSIAAQATQDVTGALSSLSGVIAAATQLEGSALSVLAPVLSSAQSAAGIINGDILANDPALDAASPDGSDPAVMASWLASTGTAMAAQSALADAAGFVTRIGMNIELAAN